MLIKCITSIIIIIVACEYIASAAAGHHTKTGGQKEEGDLAAHNGRFDLRNAGPLGVALGKR